MASLESAKNRPDLGRIKAGSEHGPEQNRNSGAQSGQTRRDFGSSRGDTHLGQFPQPGNFERFYKAGEHGAPLDIKNARYVLFRIPPAAQSGGGRQISDRQRTYLGHGAVRRTCRSKMNASRPSPTNVNSFLRATVTC